MSTTTKPYTLSDLVQDLEKLDPNTKMRDFSVYFHSPLLVESEGTCVSLSENEPFETVVVSESGGMNLVADILARVRKYAKINPNAPLKAGSGLLISGITMSPRLVSDSSLVYTSETVQKVKKLIDEVNSEAGSGNPITAKDFSALLKNAGVTCRASFTLIGNTWHLLKPNKITSKDYGCVPSEYLEELFIKYEDNPLTFYTCRIRPESYKKMFPTISPLKEKIAEELRRQSLDNDGFWAHCTDLGLGGRMIERYKDVLCVTLHGMSEERTADDKPVWTREWRDGKKNGEEIYYHANGKIKKTSFYENNKLNGLVTEYDENGTVIRKTNYSNNLANGLLETFDKNGKLLTSYTYSQDIRDGPFVEYDSEGKVAAEGTYKDGTRKLKPPAVPELVPTKLPTRFTLTVEDRKLIIEKVGTLKILIGATKADDTESVESDKIPAVTPQDRELAKKSGISVLSN